MSTAHLRASARLLGPVLLATGLVIVAAPVAATAARTAGTGAPPLVADATATTSDPAIHETDTTRQQPPASQTDRLEARAVAVGSVRVIVGLRARFEPEGRLGPRGVRDQRAAIAAQQARLLSELTGTGANVVRRFTTIPVVTLALPPAGVAALSRSPVAASVTEDVPMAPDLAQSVPLIGGAAAHGLGFGGAGEAVAILDTGVDSSHPFLAGRVVDEDCFSINANCPNGTTSQTGAGAAAPCTYAPSQCLHGTHVAGIAAGRHTATITLDGVAPDASILAMQVFSRFTGTICGSGPDPCTLSWPTDQLAALERVYALRTTYSIAAVNLSLGAGLFGSPCDLGVYSTAIDNLRSVGIATVIAAGNDGAINAISAPACSPSAVSVGSTTKADFVSSFSNSASFLSLLAPGQSITSSLPGGGFGVLSGTSMATPHVTGSFALLKQQSSTSTVSAMLGALQATGKPILDIRNNVTKPRVNVLAALQSMQPLLVAGVAAVVEGTGSTSTLKVPVGLSAASGATVTVGYQTFDYTASSPADYAAASGTLTFLPGQTAKTVDVTVNGDALDENDEALAVLLSGATNATIGGFLGLGIGIIVDDDPPPVLVPGVGSVVEGNSGTAVVHVPVSLTAPSGETVTASYQTLDYNATAPADYVTVGATVTFAPGETVKTVDVTVKGDTIREGNEAFLVAFSGATNATIGGFFGLGIGIILDDD